MGDCETISAEAFTSSLKIMIAHHYLFEPPGRKKQPALQMRNRNAVFVNITSAEYDVYICGHKHVTHFWDANYAKHFDKRSASRHLLNLFRRMIDLDAIPFTSKDKQGRKYPRSFQLLINAYVTIFKSTE